MYTSTFFYLILNLFISLLLLNENIFSQELQINWESCSLVPGANDGLAECATVMLPLFHNDPNGAKIGIAVKRLPAQNSSRGQFWFLNGGPGDSGIASFGAPASFAQIFSDLDIYTLDHRGVGGSQRLSCPEQEAETSDGGREITNNETADCAAYLLAQYGDTLNAFTVSESARDLGALIEATREPGQKVWVWGASYGTFLLNRYLQLFPNQPDGVIMDGLVPADWSFSEFDVGMDEIGRKFLDRCAQDPTCSIYLGTNPQAFTENLFNLLENGHCSELDLSPSFLRQVLGGFLLIGSPFREYVPAIIHRINRCASADVEALNHFSEALNEFLGEPESHSQALQIHIATSELWKDDAPAAEEFEAALESYLIATGVSTSFARREPVWPTYQPDEYDNTFANYSGPMLMLQGGLDPTMPIARLNEMQQQYSDQHQTFAFFPDGQHGVLNDNDCAAWIYIQFLLNPEATIDISCIEQHPPISFQGDPEISLFLFGTEDMWGSTVTSVASPDNAIPAEFTLHDSYPNPFSQSVSGATIDAASIIFSYDLSTNRQFTENVQLKVYDVLGREVAILVDRPQTTGRYSVSWNARDVGDVSLPPGIYFYRITVGEISRTKRLTIVQ